MRAILTNEGRSIPLFEDFALKELLSRPLGLYAGVGATFRQAQPSIPLLKLLEGLATLLHGGTKTLRYGLGHVTNAARQRARGRCCCNRTVISVQRGRVFRRVIATC